MAADFPDTRWTRILDARTSAAARREALAELLEVYWRPLWVFARRKGLDAAAAEDAVQDLAVQLLERDALARLDPARGRFRSFLRAALANHLANLHERRTSAKRGGGRAPLSLDVAAAERELPAAAPDPVDAFDREWALAVTGRALDGLRAELERNARGARFALVERFFAPGATPPSHADAAREFGMTPVQLKAFLHRARARYRELVRAEVAQTVRGGRGEASEAEIDAEMAELVRSLSG